jgi:cytoskeletal protein RodZ
MQAYLPIIISAIVIFTALMWWLLALGKVQREDQTTEKLAQPDPQPTIAPSAPKAVAELAREMPTATTPVPLKAGVPTKPKAKAAAPKAKVAPKAKAAPAPKAKAPAPKAKTGRKTTS